MFLRLLETSQVVACSDNSGSRCRVLLTIFGTTRDWEYLPTLQNRRKWNSTQSDIQEGDLILLKDDQSPRNKWPMALVSKVFPSADGRVCKVQLKVSKSGSGKDVMYLRPITEVIILLSKDN